MVKPTALIVGAGAGGIALAARLARLGYTVTVVEKREQIGGRCSLIHRNGFRFDQGPSLLLMPEIFEQTFRDLGTSLEEEDVNLLKCEPNYNVWFPDKSMLQVTTDFCKMKQLLERYEGKSAFSKFLSYMQEAGKHYDLSMAHVMSRNFPTLWSMIRPEFVTSVFSMHPFDSVYGRVSRYFGSEELRKVFTFASMYLGMNPFDAPGTYTLLQYTELAHGISYPAGGFQKVLDALVRIGQRHGVTYRLNASVTSTIISEEHVARGIRLQSGEKLFADIVVINADLVYAYKHLLPSSPTLRGLAQRPASCSSISFFWSFDRIIPELQGHNVFLANEYRDSFDAIFKRNSLPREPSFYVNVPSRIDKSAAPPGKDAVVVLVPVGHLLEDRPQDWPAMVDFARSFVLDTIEARTGATNLRRCLLEENVETPLTWRTKFNLDRGAILGLSHSFFNVLSFRPKTKHSSINNLYFVGASTHPGTGVPVCLAGSKIVCDQIYNDAQKIECSMWTAVGRILTLFISIAIVLGGIKIVCFRLHTCFA